MPKAPSNSGGPSSSRPSLRRNQACRSCRRRKLKCDAQRPHCSTCVRQWQALISVPAPVGYAHPPEPQCSYDPVDGLTLAPEIEPLEKIKQLEAQITSLKSQLYEQQARPTSRNASAGPSSQTSPSPILPRPLLDKGGIALPHMSIMSILKAEEHAASPSTTDSPDSNGSSASSNGKKPDHFMDLLFSGWNPDLPDPPTLNHYIDVFFRCDPCGSRVLHKPSFLSAMLLSPRDPGFPHSAILHAICTAASRWSPQNVTILPDGSRRDQFAEFHASKARHYIDRTMATGEDIFSVLQACILLSWYFYQEGRWVEVWIFAGFQTRVAVPLRLNYPGTFSTSGNSSPGAYLAPPKDLQDLESRRRTWWMTIVFDRIASVGGWIHAVDERDLGTELPLRNEDFESQVGVPSNPQDLSSPNIFTKHPAQYTDSFLLFIKAVMLFGRVTDYNVRGNLRAATAPSKHTDPFALDGFEALDKLVSHDFLESIPYIYKTNNGVTDAVGGSSLDTDLYMVHIVPHAAAITLHNHYLDFTNPESLSTSRCVNAARSILSAYYMLSATSLDITRLHPFITICWYLAAVVQVHLCKYFIEIGDAEREATVWGEINVLRFAMLAYGQRSPIGTRQERLLKGLMKEIVRMTAQKQPLEVGVPLYPFSSNTLWRKDGTGVSTDGSMNPLPASTSPDSMDQIGASPSMPPSAWMMQHSSPGSENSRGSY